MLSPRRSASLGAIALAIAGVVLAGGALTTPTEAPIPAATPEGVRPNNDVVTVIGGRRARSLSRVEVRRFTSTALRRSMPYLVYLPPGYETEPDRAYPTLYLLHGDGGNDLQWVETGILDEAERMIRSGEIAPLIIIMPEGERGYWLDHANNGPKWGTYVAVDVVADVQVTYRAQPGREYRAIGGISMGAHGATQLSMNFPGTYAAVGAHSLALRRFGSAPAFFGNAVQYSLRDPMGLIYSNVDVARSTALWLDIGDRDPWTPLARQYHRELSELQIVHAWHEWPGDHSGKYWSAHVADYLRFYDGALGRIATAN